MSEPIHEDTWWDLVWQERDELSDARTLCDPHACLMCICKCLHDAIVIVTKRTGVNYEERENAFDAGVEAFIKHYKTMSAFANPYREGSPEWQKWEDGWKSASDGAYDAWRSGK